MERPADYAVRATTMCEVATALTSTIRLAVGALGYRRTEDIFNTLLGDAEEETKKNTGNRFSILDTEDTQTPPPPAPVVPPTVRKRWADLVDEDD